MADARRFQIGDLVRTTVRNDQFDEGVGMVVEVSDASPHPIRIEFPDPPTGTRTVSFVEESVELVQAVAEVTGDPRILPAEVLVEWQADAERGQRDQLFCSCVQNERRIVAMGKHIEALAEQIEMATEQPPRLAVRLMLLYKAQCDAAIQALTEKDRAIRDLLDKGKRGDIPGHALPDAIRALIEDGSNG
jgi:hypothetical protein